VTALAENSFHFVTRNHRPTFEAESWSGFFALSSRLSSCPLFVPFTAILSSAIRVARTEQYSETETCTLTGLAQHITAISSLLSLTQILDFFQNCLVGF
jgi:hypothetical protein